MSILYHEKVYLARSAQVGHAATNTVVLLILTISVYNTASHKDIVSSTMSTKPFRKLKIRGFFKRPLPTPSSSSEPSDSRADASNFGNFIDGVDASQTVAKTVYNGTKILLDVIDKVGYAVPPLKAAASGIGRIMTIVDVCTYRHLATATVM